MKLFLFAISFISLAFSSFAEKPGPPPKDSTGKDYGYYFNINFAKPKSFDSTLFLAKRFFDSCYTDRYKIVGVDTATQSFKIRVTEKLKTHGMLKNTHKPEYTNCYMTFDYILYNTETGLRCKVKRIIHYYTLNTESGYMGTTNGKKTMRTESKPVEIPMIQTDLGVYTKKVLQEVNEDITASIAKIKSYKWNFVQPKSKVKKSIEDDDY